MQYWQEYSDRLPEYEQKYGDALEYVLERLQVLQNALCMGGRVQQFRYSFLHPEGGGLFAICCSARGKRVTRLYIYPDETTNVLHVLTIGGKNKQQDDIKNCHETILKIKSNVPQQNIHRRN